MAPPVDAPRGRSCDRSERPCSWSVGQRVVRALGFTLMVTAALAGLAWLFALDDSRPSTVF